MTCRFADFEQDVWSLYKLQLGDQMGKSTGWPSLDEVYRVRTCLPGKARSAVALLPHSQQFVCQCICCLCCVQHQYSALTTWKLDPQQAVCGASLLHITLWYLAHHSASLHGSRVFVSSTKPCILTKALQLTKSNLTLLQNVSH